MRRFNMDVAAFQSLYPEEVRIQLDRKEWVGDNMQYYDAENHEWYNLASFGQALMFPENKMNFSTVEGLIKSSIVSGRQFAIIVEGNLLGFVRGNDLQTSDGEEMDIDIDWSSTNDQSIFYTYDDNDMFSPEQELTDLL